MKHLTDNPFKSATVALLLAVLMAIILYVVPGKENENTSLRIINAEKKLVELKEKVALTLAELSKISNEKETDKFFLNQAASQRGISYYQLKDNALVNWSDNEPATDAQTLSNVKDGELMKLHNGDFLAGVLIQNNFRYVGLILLKHEYVYENKYLVNNFNPALGLGTDFNVAQSGDTLHLPGNKPAYMLKRDTSVSIPPSGIIVAFCFLIAIIVMIAFYFFLRFFSVSLLKTSIFILLVFGLRTLMIYFKIPSGFYDHGIFSPAHYASSFYFNSLGDLLLNAGLLLVLIISLFEQMRTFKGDRFVVFILWVSAAYAIHLLIRGLVINSDISFAFSRPGDLNLYSILAFTAISLLLLCLLYITSLVLKTFTKFEITAKNTLLGISICAIYATFSLYKLNAEKENETRKLIAQKIEVRQDHIAEYLFLEMEEKIASDSSISSIFRSANNPEDELSSYLSQDFFNGYLSKFEVKAILYDETNEESAELVNYRKIAATGKATSSKQLFYLSSETGGSSYLAIIPMKNGFYKQTLAITLNARFLKSEKGFPELLMSGTQEPPLSDEYSIARYSYQSLVYEFGNYIYPLTGKSFQQPQDEFSFSEYNGYSHMVRKLNDHSFVIISKPVDTTLELLTLFSWMFTFMSVIAFVVFIFSVILGVDSRWYWSLTRRVQAAVIFLVILTFVLVGIGTVSYINTKYLNDQRKSISDQVNALWFMVSENLNTSKEIESRYVGENRIQLDRLVNNTNIDFNIYNEAGGIEYSSNPKIFVKGIVSSRMNPIAYLRIKEEGLTQFIHPENAGRLKYISAYAPITGPAGNIIAYLNLPYFEKQNELNNEVSVFLSALVNIYVLLFAITVLVTIFISSLITKPLLLLQEKMSGVRLGVINEKIAYREKDEIGQLVQEYNRMIDELADSAEKLSRSERESAWREMAKQVAHEIKNPLTPMKLSVQHLLRTFKENKQDLALVERISNTLIQQIDTLSNIANAFSNFAKMPQAVPVKVNVEEIMQQVIQLYNTGVEIEMKSVEGAFVMADKDQFIGIFSNLLKNAVQSIPEEKHGKIGIQISRSEDRIVIEISDNGIGIPENQRDKIFVPNFTTKSSGMGLGLAIVRNIVEETNGKIWFTSTYGEGSNFFVSLPAAV